MPDSIGVPPMAGRHHLSMRLNATGYDPGTLYIRQLKETLGTRKATFVGDSITRLLFHHSIFWGKERGVDMSNDFVLLSEKHITSAVSQLRATDVLVVNVGVHVKTTHEYAAALDSTFKLLDSHARRGGLAIFRDTNVAHFPTADGEFEGEPIDKRTATSVASEYSDYACTPVLRKTGNGTVSVAPRGETWRNQMAQEVAVSFPNVAYLHFGALSEELWTIHPGSGVMQQGKLQSVGTDCLHYCYSPTMLEAFVFLLDREIRKYDAARVAKEHS